MCLGAGLAVQEATVVLATLMRRFVLGLVPGQSVWPIDFTMKPRDGLRMAVTVRLSRAQFLEFLRRNFSLFLLKCLLF
jgi:cytochrome P450